MSVIELPERTVHKSLSGEVVDSTGAPVGGSLIEVIDTDSQKPVASQTASDSGEFHFEDLPLGRHYKLEIKKDGFDPLWVPLKVLQHGGARHLRLKLTIAT